MKTDNQGNGKTLNDVLEAAKNAPTNVVAKFAAGISSMNDFSPAQIATLSSALADDLTQTNRLTPEQGLSVAIGAAAALSQSSDSARFVALVTLQITLGKLLDQTSDQIGLDRKIMRNHAASQIVNPA